MTETGTEGSEPPAQEWSWTELLTRLTYATGAQPESEDVAIAARHAEQEEGEDWTNRLVRACEQLGLHATRLHGTARQIAREVGPDHPVVARTADGRWLLLVDRRGRQLRVESPSDERAVWMRRGDVVELIDPTEAGASDWVAVNPPVFWTADEPAGLTQEEGHPSPLRRLRWLVRQERNDVAAVLVYAIGVGVLTLAIPIAVQALVNSVAFGALIQPLFVLTVLLLGGLLFAGALKALEEWVVELLQQRLFVHLVSDLSHRLPRVRMSALDATHGPELLNRFFDLFTIQKSVALLLIGGLEIVLTAVVGLIVIAFYHPFLLAFDVLLVAALAVVVFVMGRGATRTALHESSAKYEMAGWLEELARVPALFKLGGGTELARARSDTLAADWLAARRAHFRVIFRQLLGALLLQAVASAGVLAVGGWLVIERELTLGQLVAAELIVTGIVASFARAPKYFAATYDLFAALDKVGHLVDLPMERPDDAVSAPEPSPRGSRLTACGLTFGYEGDAPLFEDLELIIEPGARVAVSGRSGAGRTTLVDVLSGARAPMGGRVELDGVDLRDLGRDRLRRRVAAVRGPEIVDGTIADNVAFGRPRLTSEDVRESLRAMDLLDEVSGLPDGIKTRLAPTGAPLSRGAAVRVALARAVAGEPSLLFLDRALDWLDDETLETVLPVLLGDDAPWTAVVISERAIVHRHCDRVLTLDDGTIEEAA